MRCNHCGSIMHNILTDTLGHTYHMCNVCNMVQDHDYAPCNGKRVAYTVDGKYEVCTLPDFNGIKMLNTPHVLAS